jgi:hypothetical protein
MASAELLFVPPDTGFHLGLRRNRRRFLLLMQPDVATDLDLFGLARQIAEPT